MAEGRISFKVLPEVECFRAICLPPGMDSVTYPESPLVPPFGVTAHSMEPECTKTAPDGHTPIIYEGLAELYFNDFVKSGGLVAVDSEGRGVPHVDSTVGSWTIGRLLGPTIEATGTIAQVLVCPMYRSLPIEGGNNESE